MKKFSILVLLAVVGSSVFGQMNLVPNPSFEDTVYCPSTLNQMNAASGWSSGNSIGTPDYYNTCSSTPGIAPPNTLISYQYPLTGNGCAGIVALEYMLAFPDYREFISAHLLSPLQIGTKYIVSFYVNRGYGVTQHYTLANNKLGALFSTVAYSPSNPAPENNFAHVYTDNIVTDTLNWFEVRGSFIADSAYQFINIGNFFDNIHTDTLNFGDSLATQGYYFVDDVSVFIDSTASINGAVQNNTFTVFPNPASDILNIEIVQSREKVYTELIITDILGAKVFEKDIKGIFSKLLLNVSSLTNGIYFIKLLGVRESLNKKILINHSH